MSYNIPGDDRLAEAIFVVMYRNQQVRSQKEMVELVSQELNKNGGCFRVSGRRIRYLAVQKDLLSISIEYNNAEGERPELCPVCGGQMRSVVNGTLDGDTIEVMRKCSVCPFSVGLANRTPGKYIFTKKKR